MKTIATVISASVLAVASASVSAWGWGPDGGFGYPYYGYAPYAYAPYGYGVPMQAPAQLTDEQRKAMQDQQARALEYMQTMQRQMAQYYAEHPDPIYAMERRMYEDEVAHMQEMNKMMQETQQDIDRDMQDSMSPYPMNDFGPSRTEDTARLQEIEKQAQEHRKAAEERRAAFLKAAEQRRLDAEKRYQERRLNHDYRANVVPAPTDQAPPPSAVKKDDTKG
jgi:hypothetical protein